MAEMKWRREILLPMAVEEWVREIARVEEVLVADMILDLIERGIDHYLAEGDSLAAEQQILDHERAEDEAEAEAEPVDVMAQADEDAANAWARAETQLRQFVAEVEAVDDAVGDDDTDDADDVNDGDEIIRVGDERDAEFEAMIPQKPLVRLKRGHYENQPIYMRDIKGLNWDDRYLVLAEVESIDHYVVMNLTTGKILRGMFHLDRFERVPSDEI